MAEHAAGGRTTRGMHQGLRRGCESAGEGAHRPCSSGERSHSMSASIQAPCSLRQQRGLVLLWQRGDDLHELGRLAHAVLELDLQERARRVVQWGRAQLRWRRSKLPQLG